MSCCIVATLRWWLHLRHPYRYPRLHRNLHHHSQYPLLPQLQMMMLLLFVVVTRIVPMWMWTVAQHKSMDITWIVVTMRLLMVVVMVTNNIFDRPTPSPTSTPPRDPSLPPPATTSNRKIILTMDRDIALPSTTFGGPLPILRFISLRHPNKISVEDKPTFGPSRKRRPCAGFRLSVANSVSWTFVPIRPMRVEDSWPIPLSKAKLKMDPNNSGFRATLKFRMDGREQFGIKSLWGRLVACRMLAFRIHPYRR
mmetsp:Transcript_6405/g.15074  ORF Transcript_6405/g.15074 Transcript_6405/m.15074 type:complete len:253 (-) Transcript_6405:2938-3696(-)